MPDRKLYYEDAARERVTTSVVEAGASEGRPWVRLDETIFYPEGGGQPADRGTIAGIQVVDVQPRGDEVLHFLETPLRPGPVEAILDARRRFDHRQQHTAQHLLTAILADRHALPTTSFHLGAEVTAIEVEGAVPSPSRLRELEDEANAEIRKDRPVLARWVEPEALPALRLRTRGLPAGHTGPVRLVEIEGLDLNTCGGTHVSRLAEIQAVHLVGAEPARGCARIRFLAGGRLLDEAWRSQALETELKARIGTAPAEFPAVLDGWQAERKRLERQVRHLEETLAQRDAAALAAEPGPILKMAIPGAGPGYLRALAAAVLGSRPEAVVVLAGECGDPLEACFLVQSGPLGPDNSRDLGQRLAAALGAKGGGGGRLFQGKGGRLPASPTFLEGL